MPGQVPYTGIPQNVDDGIPRAYEQGDASPAAFGGQIGNALQRAGGALEQGSDRLMGAAIRQQELLNKVAGDDAMNTLQEKANIIQFGDPNDPTKPGYYSLKGKNAIAARAAAEQQLEQTREQLAQGLNPRARLDFENYSRRFVSATRMDIARHYAQQVDSYAIATNKATEDLQEQSAGLNYDNDQQWNNLLADAHNSVVKNAQIAGASPEMEAADLARVTDKLATSRALAWSARDPVAADAWVRQNANLFDPGRFEQLTGHLRPQVEDSAAHAAVELAMGGQSAGIPRPVRSGPAANVTALWDATKQQESGGRQLLPNGQPVTSSAGAIGVSQLMPDTARAEAKLMDIPYDEQRLKTDAAYNESIGKHLMSRLVEKYDGDQTLALAAYNAGEGAVGKWIDQNGDPRLGQISDADWASKIPIDETRAYVPSVLARAGGAAPSAASAYAPRGIPAFDDIADRIYGMNLPPAVEDKAISRASSIYHHMMQANEGAQASLRMDIGDDIAARQDGHDGKVTEAQIYGLFPQPEAQKYVEALHEASTLGEAVKVVNTLTPEAIEAKRAQLEAFRASPDTGGYAEHDKTLTAFNQAVARRDTAIKADPNAFVLATDPAVQGALAGVRTNDPSTVQTYMQANLAAQERLGVPLAERSVLTADQAKGLVAKIVGAAAPQRGAMLRGMEQTYGHMWPEVMGSMIRQGKLPGEYQVLGIIDDPVKQQALSMAIGDGKDAIKKAIPKGTLKQIDNDIADDGSLAMLAKSMPFAPDAFANIRAGVTALAYGLAYSGDRNPVGNAIAAVTADKYDFASEGYRIPKGRWDIRAEADRQAAALDAGSLVALHNPTGEPLAPDYVSRVTLDNAKNGYWVTNENDDGLVRMGANHNPVMINTRGRPSRMEIPFGWSYAGDVAAQRAALSERLRLGYVGAPR